MRFDRRGISICRKWRIENGRSPGYAGCRIKFFERKGEFMGASDNDMRAHRETYEGVMGLLKWGTVATAIIGMVVILIIAS